VLLPEWWNCEQFSRKAADYSGYPLSHVVRRVNTRRPVLRTLARLKIWCRYETVGMDINIAISDLHTSFFVG
jgi:hypothetical protein